MADSKNDLVSQTPMQHDPYRAKPSDFPVSGSDKLDGQGSGAHGFSSGKDELAKQSPNQIGPRHVEDGGPGPKGSGTPTSWQSGGRSGTVASNFPVGKNSGESNSGASSLSISESINLQTGKIQGPSQTRVGEVPESKVHIPSR